MEQSLDKKYTGFILKDAILHLYEDPEDLRNDLTKWGRDWSQIAWIEGTVIHKKENKSD